MKRTMRQVISIVAWLSAVSIAQAQSAARDAGYLYLSPVPGAPYVSAQTRYVLVRLENVTPSEVTNLTTSFISVTGTNSGPHTGATHVASDGKTVIFEMTSDFSENELVTVNLDPQVNAGTGGTVEPYEYQFMVTASMPGSLTNPVLPSATKPTDGPSPDPKPTEDNTLGAAAIMPNGVSVPGDFPGVVITVSSNPSPGNIFLSNPGRGSYGYWIMLDNDGLPVWYRRGGGVFFKVEENDMIALVEHAGFTTVYDQDFQYVKTCHTANGYESDPHEVLLLGSGGNLLLGNRLNPVDMSQYVIGGVTNATVWETVIQEFTAAGELIFQWRAWDHYDVRDILGGINLMGFVPFSHMNALEVDADGHILVSSRELSEVTKINRETGEIIWRLSGNNSSFSFSNDPLNGFSYQHDINLLNSGHYMVFDNGNGRNPQVSRAAEYELNLANMTATLVWEFRDTPDKYTWVKGNAQRLPSGNTLINFVQRDYPAAVEVDSNGLKRFELSLVPNGEHYRLYRFPWNGAVGVPYLIIEPQQDNVALIFNKFGDTNVAYYRIYGDPSPQPTTLLATSTTTLKHLTNLENGQRYHFRVTAVDEQGQESGYSNEETLIVNIIKPGEQMVQNGDFSQGTNSWTLLVSGGASADWRITNSLSHFDIVSGGRAVSSIQLQQTGKVLLQGKRYVFEFDAWSQAPRYIEAKIAQPVSPFASYSGSGFPFLTPTHSHFRYVFTMQAASDFNASVIFNLGSSPLDVFLDNISLFNTAPGDFNLDGQVDYHDLKAFTGEWLKQLPGLASDLDEDGVVNFRDLSVFGEDWNPGP